MSSDSSLMSTDIDFDREGLNTGVIRVPHSVHRSAYGHLTIPIAVAKNGEGPTVLLTGGVHGDGSVYAAEDIVLGSTTCGGPPHDLLETAAGLAIEDATGGVYGDT